MKKRFRKLLSILCTLAMLVCAFAALADEQGAEVTDPPEVTEGEATIQAEGDEPGTLEAEVEDLDELPVVTEETEEEAETPEKPAEVPAEEEPEETAGEPELTEGNAEEFVSESVTLQEAVEEQAGETPVGAEPAGEEPAADQPEPADEPADAPETEEPAAPVEPTAPAEEPAVPAEEPEAAEPAAENNPPTEEVSQPEEPAAPAENKPESKPEEKQPAETPEETPEGEPQEELIQPEEEQPEEPAEDPEEPEEEPEEEPAEEQDEILLNLNGQTSVSGELTIDTPFTFSISDDYYRTLVITLIVQKEDSITVIRGENSIPLTKIVNSDPNCTDILYTFERETVAGQMYTYILNTEDAGLISFAIDISEKTEETVNNEVINQEQTEVQENTDGIPSEVTEESLDENKEENDELPTERKIEVAILWDEEHPTYGATAHFVATLMGYEGLEYTMQWQWSENDVDWYNVEGATEDHLDVVYSEENGDYNWRILVDVVTP